MKFGSILILFTLSASAQPTVKVLSVVNSASFQSSLPLGGGLATVFCSGLPYPPWIMPGSFVAPGGTSLPYQLDGIAIEVNGGPAPILSVYVPPAGQSTPTQINFQVPAARNSTLSSGIDNGSLTISVFSLGPGNQGVFGTLAALTPLPGSSLGGFFTDINGNAIAQHADNSLVAVQNPAHLAVFASRICHAARSAFPIRSHAVLRTCVVFATRPALPAGATGDRPPWQHSR